MIRFWASEREMLSGSEVADQSEVTCEQRYSSVSRARYVECRLARVGVCELAIMRETR